MYNTWEELEEGIKECKKCKLHTTRKNIVFGVRKKRCRFNVHRRGTWSRRRHLAENHLLEKHGKLMDKAFQGLGIKREEVYIANIVKCRPPQNRNPEDDEAEACIDYLRSQVMLVNPKVIVLLGSVALKNILGKEYGITASRGKWVEKNNILYMPTWHPAALLRDENKKIEFWKDLKEAIVPLRKEK